MKVDHNAHSISNLWGATRAVLRRNIVSVNNIIRSKFSFHIKKLESGKKIKLKIFEERKYERSESILRTRK